MTTKKRKKNTSSKSKKNEGAKTTVMLKDFVSEETTQAVLAVFMFMISLFLTLAHFGSAGIAGTYTYNALYSLMGVGSFLTPLLFLLLSISFLKTLQKHGAVTQSLGALIFLIANLGLIDIILGNLIESPGGVIGTLMTAPLLSLFDVYVTTALLSAFVLIALLIIFDRFITFTTPLSELFFSQGSQDTETQTQTQELGTFQITSDTTTPDTDTEKQEKSTTQQSNEPIPSPPIRQNAQEEAPSKKEELDLTPTDRRFAVQFKPPPLKLLATDSGKPGVGDIKANANIIKRTLANFNVQVEMDEVSVGPTVTRYALKPAEGVKLSRIVGLKNDLALALAASRIRIEAPIPGKSLVGIEIPNTTKSTIGLGTLLASQEFEKSNKPLLMALGKGITGDSHFANLAKMPHILIAGATGSGKSVTIHSLVTSLLYRNSPDYLRFIMIDPKRVELTLYNSIPHLLTPVITDPKQAILALKWAQKEMNRRYDILEEEQVRDIASYHENVLDPALARQKRKKKDATEEEDEDMPEKMPYIVIIIDELADIMQTYPRELEASIVRLAQMSRAVGIHLALSTQRPSVNVITGLIKANVPARIALQVASQVDSRTILDASGAESLLGAGDMLYLSGEMSKPTRLQSAFISEEELKKVVNHLAEQYKEIPPDQIDFASDENAVADISIDGENSNDDDDELFEEARELVIKMQKASTSLVQRKLKVGYARAARLMDTLEERGIVSESEGSKPRRVLVGNNEEAEFGTDESAGFETPDEQQKDHQAH